MVKFQFFSIKKTHVLCLLCDVLSSKAIKKKLLSYAHRSTVLEEGIRGQSSAYFAWTILKTLHPYGDKSKTVTIAPKNSSYIKSSLIVVQWGRMKIIGCLREPHCEHLPPRIKSIYKDHWKTYKQELRNNYTFIIFSPCWRCWRLASESRFLFLHWSASFWTFDLDWSRFLIWSSNEPQRRPALSFLFGGRTVWTDPRENLGRNRQ